MLNDEWYVLANGLIQPLICFQLDSTWIVFNRPHQELSDEYAGFLMALGLNGHLASLLDYEIYSHLDTKHELTVVGLLLGLSASR